jgi:hypothetical protein
MADDAKSGTGNPVVDALVAALGAFNKDSLGALRPVRAIDGVPFAEIALAYAQMKRAAGCISAAVARKAAGGPILFDPDEKLLDLAAFRGCLTALDILIPLIEKDVAAGKELLEKEATELTFSVVLALIAPAISAALAIGALFKTDVSEKYADIKIEDGALTGWLAKMLRKKNVTLLSEATLAQTYSEWRAPPKDGTSKTAAPGRLRAKLEALTTTAGDLYETSGKIQQRLKQVDKPDAKLTAEEEKLAGMAARLNHSIESVKSLRRRIQGNRAERLPRRPASCPPRKRRLRAVGAYPGGSGQRAHGNRRPKLHQLSRRRDRELHASRERRRCRLRYSHVRFR